MVCYRAVPIHPVCRVCIGCAKAAINSAILGLRFFYVASELYKYL